MKTLKIFFPLITTDVLTVDILQVKLREFSDSFFFSFVFFFFFCLEKVKHASYMRTEIAQEHHGCLIGSSVLLLLLSVNVCLCVCVCVAAAHWCMCQTGAPPAPVWKQISWWTQSSREAAPAASKHLRILPP